MGKNIVLLSDGTGNSAAKLFKTNVWRLYQALDVAEGSDQIAFYDDGVGTSTFRPLAVLGGALGIGLKRNVKEIYTFLCRNYEPGDRIYAFGFSRGAFTIRVLVGMIATQGVIPGRTMAPEALRRAVDAAYTDDRRDYKTKWRRWGTAAPTATETDPVVPPGRQPATIEFVGLWDTVDAYGLPVDELKRGLDYWWLGLSFPDQDLSPIVKRACHALSLDDERRTFHPVLWNEAFESELVKKGKVSPDRLQQVWFAGMHSNVGGGYAKDGLSYVPLQWIVHEATAVKLKVHGTALAEFDRMANIHDTMGDSRAGLSAYYRYDPRRLSVLCNDSYSKVWITRPKIHHSVLDRIGDHRVDYVPHVIPSTYDIVGPDGAVVQNTYEKDGEARTREADLERAWDLVWWRRFAYFVTIAFTAALAVPWMWPVEPAKVCQGRLCVVEPVLVAAGKFLPGYAQTWIAPFRIHIDVFLTLAAGLVLAMAWRILLDRRILARASEAWAHVAGLAVTDRPRWGPLSRVARSLRTSAPIVYGYRWLARSALPFLFFVATIVALLFGANKLLFEIAEAAGGTCKPTKDDVRVLREGSLTVDAPFETKNPCFATRIRLVKGATYDVAFTVQQRWIDNSHATTPAGFTSGQGGWVFRAFTPLRRSWGANWFQPIARIGATARDRHDPVPRVDEASGTHVLRLTAHTDGELFLFVNDAIVALPGVWSWFYDGGSDDSQLKSASDRTGVNNKGTASISISHVPR